MNDLQITLLAARTLIADESDLCRLAPARRADGSGTRPEDPLAVTFCPMGAMWFADPAYYGKKRLYRLALIELERMTGDVARFADSSTHAEILAAFDRALENAGEYGMRNIDEIYLMVAKRQYEARLVAESVRPA